jgi:uncharacterized protein (DUF849 family)
MMDTILNLTPTGMVPTKAMAPCVPISVSEIVDEVLRCHEIGITMVHLHARDEEGKPTHRADVYGPIIEGIRKGAPDLVICVSLSGRSVREFEKRSEPLKLTGNAKPDMGSLTMSSLNFVGEASLNQPDVIQALAQKMMRLGIVPELEIFDLGMANYAGYLLKKGLLQSPLYANVFLGNIAGAQLDMVHAGTILRDLPAMTYWSFGGIGEAQLSANALAIAMGGGVRVGLEDSIWYDRERTTKASNTMLVRRIHELSEQVHLRPIMEPSTFRDLMKMPIGGRR